MNRGALTVDLIGSGNVAYHLAHRFARVGINLRTVYVRNAEKVNQFPSGFSSQPLDALRDHAGDHPLVMAVSDDAIPALAEKIPHHSLVMHTSGSAALNALPQPLRAVLYPLQSFSRARSVDWQNVPLIIEASNDEAFSAVQMLANAISNRVESLNSEQRLHLHLAAVIVNNFVNHLFGLSAGYLASKQLPFDLLQPLIHETASKIGEIPPMDAQTGPAKRNDQTTIQRHLKMLADHPDAHAAYKLLTEQIIRLHHER
jgi:predicted short-subunit dehydrogenase-like oxidoreductase (DUF2520 family)